MPRRYSMERRQAAVEETRQRIIDATVSLHALKGVSGTSMQEIAARAGVSLGTVYRHFPTVEDLIPACGGRNMELTPPPTPDIFAGLDSVEERARALFDALYAHYEAADRAYCVGFAEAERYPVMGRVMAEADAFVRSLAAEAIMPLRPSEKDLGLTVAMADYHTWRAFSRAGFSTEKAAELAAGIVLDHLRPLRRDA